MGGERNALYCGDNLELLRRHGGDETVDLVYLDPPFNSGQNYHQLYKARKGARPAVPIPAFDLTSASAFAALLDTWVVRAFGASQEEN